MRRIPHELLLLGECAAHPFQQQIQFLDQRLDLVGQALHVDGRQVLGLTRRHLGAGALDRTQRPADHAPDDQHQQGRRGRDGGDGAQSKRARHVLAHVHVLGHLDHLERRGQRIHAVGGALHPGIGKAQHDLVGQGAARPRIEHAQAVRGPYLDDQVVGDGRARPARMGGAGPEQPVARAQRQGGALQQGIKDVVGLRQRAAVGDCALHQRADRNGGQQEEKQAGSQRVAKPDAHVLGMT
ncbi:hypothetical protein D3C78_1217990 [compost metagenome]